MDHNKSRDRFIPEPDHAASFPGGRFALAVAAQIVLMIWGFAYWRPATFHTELQAAPWLLLWVPVFSLFLSGVEYAYHRYFLHEKPITILKSMCDAHRHHHGLTSVTARVLATQPDQPVPVSSQYAIEHKDQEEDMMFPLYALSIFFVLFVPLALVLKLVLPSQPLVLAMVIAIVISYVGYEVLHAILHLPFERFWKPRLYDSPHRRFYQAIYGPHLVHHYRVKTNMAVFGFFGYPIWDKLLKTYVELAVMPLPGAYITYRQSQHQPGKLISWFDSLIERLEQSRLKRFKRRELRRYNRTQAK